MSYIVPRFVSEFPAFVSFIAFYTGFEKLPHCSSWRFSFFFSQVAIVHVAIRFELLSVRRVKIVGPVFTLPC